MQFALKNVNIIELSPTNQTSREKHSIDNLQNAVVDGSKIREGLPWLFELYEKKFLGLAEMATKKKLLCAVDDLYAINFNVQIGNHMRYECHVDSNPTQGMLYVTTHLPDQGGELIVANQKDVYGIEEVDKDYSSIQPQSGLLVFFDARRHSHYVRPLTDASSVRVAIAMNYYDDESGEADRPKGLSEHLGLVKASAS